MRRRMFVLATIAALALGMIPAGAVPTPVIAENVELLTTFPDAGAISTAFASDKPVMYVNTLSGITIYDITNPEAPVLKSHFQLPHFENEGMTLGERADGTKFVLIGIDAAAVAPTSTKPYIVGTSQHHVYLIDVTDPAAPKLRGNVDTKTSSHTIACVNAGCEYAYTSGAYNNKFSVIDLRDLDKPAWVKDIASPVFKGSGTGHQWTVDDAGYMWVSGWGGTAVYDTTDPLNPIPVGSTDANGTKAPYNDFIQHNVYRPGAKAFTQAADPVTGRLTSGSKETATPMQGNVALITEEAYENPDCQQTAVSQLPAEGGFSTWYVPYMDAAQYATDNPGRAANKGGITPLDTWNSELANSGMPTPAGALCSAHYFTYHQAGFVAQGWYAQGTRILDVRNPRDIKQVGYFFTGASETWHAYFVPARDAAGKVTGEMTNIVYTNDVARGIDVLKVTLPSAAPADTQPVEAPILPQWLDLATGSAALPSKDWGYLCRLAPQA